MASGFLEWVSGVKGSDSDNGFSIAPGVVTDNLNILLEGRVQVHIPALPEFDPWARVAAVGGGSGRGFLWIPQVDDEVLVAFNKNDDRDAYIIGGLWSTLNRPPALLPTDFLTKRIIKTGVTNSPMSHTIEIDDLLQSIKITTSTEQEIVLDPTKITITTTKGLLKISLDMLSVPPGISLEATAGDIKLSAPLGTISLEGLNVKVQGTLSTEVSSDLAVDIKGTMVSIN